MQKTLLPLLVALWLAPAGTAATEEDEPDSRITGARPAPEPAGAVATVSLSPERQALAGIQWSPLERYQSPMEAHAYGRVFDIKELLALRARYRTALSELSIAEAQLKVARNNFARLSHLHRESIIATRDLIQSEAQLASEQARCEGFRRNLREVREDALQTWGGELFRQAMENESALFRALLERSRVLLLVTLSAGEPQKPAPRLIKVSPFGDRQQARDAELFSAAPRTDESTQGETWFYSADATGMRSGMRLDAWVPKDDRLRSGVLIPLTAVVWRDGSPWVYVRTSSSEFTRRPLGDHRDMGRAWFVDQGFQAGEELVVRGGQTLLSEELRSRIPAEDGDND